MTLPDIAASPTDTLYVSLLRYKTYIDTHKYKECVTSNRSRFYFSEEGMEASSLLLQPFKEKQIWKFAYIVESLASYTLRMHTSSTVGIR